MALYKYVYDYDYDYDYDYENLFYLLIFPDAP